MAITLHILGSSKTARRSFSGAVPATLASISGNEPVVGTTGYTGEIGGQSIIFDPNNAGIQGSCLQYLGRNNIPAHAFSMLWRGSFGVNTGLVGICGWASGISSANYAVDLYFNSGTLNSRIKDAQQNDRGTIAASWTPTINQIYDILLVWNGQNGGTSTLYVDGVSVGTVSATYQRAADDRPNINYLTIGAMEFDVAGTKTTLNEFLLDDTVLNPASVTLTSGSGALNGNARTAFILSTALDATAYTFPATSDIHVGVAGINAGVAVVGTYDGSDRYTDFGNSNIADGVAGKYNSTVNNRLGTIIPAVAATTKHGVAASDGTGSYRGADLNSDPGDDKVLTTGSYNADGVAKTGRVTLPDAGQVVLNEEFGLDDAQLGTYAATAPAPPPPNLRGGLLKSAFNAITRMNSQAGYIKRPGNPDLYTPMRMTSSNYFRQLAGPSQTVVTGSECIIPIATIVGQKRIIFTPNHLPTAGTFTFAAQVNGTPQVTAPIAWNANAGQVQTALRLLPGLEHATVGQVWSGGTLTIDFVGSKTVESAVIDITSLTTTTAVTQVIEGIEWDDPVIKRGDRLLNAAGTSFTVTEVIEMPDFGGEVLGYRVRYE